MWHISYHCIKLGVILISTVARLIPFELFVSLISFLITPVLVMPLYQVCMLN